MALENEVHSKMEWCKQIISARKASVLRHADGVERTEADDNSCIPAPEFLTNQDLFTLKATRAIRN